MKVLQSSFLTALILVSLLTLNLGRCANIKGNLEGPIDPIVGTWVGECRVSAASAHRYTYVFTYDGDDEQISLTVTRVFFLNDLTCMGNNDIALVQRYGVSLGAASPISFNENSVDAQEIDYTATAAEVTAYTAEGKGILDTTVFVRLAPFELNQPVSVAGQESSLGFLGGMNNGARYYSRVYIDTSLDPHRLYIEIDLEEGSPPSTNIDGNAPGDRAVLLMDIDSTNDSNERQSD